MLRRSVRAISRVNAGIIVLLTGVMLVTMALQVFMRSVMNSPPSWTEEVSLACFTWAVMLGMAQGVRQGIHVRMDLLVDALPMAMRVSAERLVLLATGAVGVFLAYAGYHYTISSFGTTSAAVSYPMPLLYASASASGLLVALFSLEALFLGDKGNADERAV
jgi:TRAP-type C4-dicarboxylate transport system permease small subunit